MNSLRIRVAGSDSYSVLRRMLTIVGYEDADPPPAESVRFMTFVRIFPGKFDQAYQTVTSLGGDIHALDGKWDLAVLGTKAGPKFMSKQRAIIKDESNRSKIQKMETHLLFMPADLLLQRVTREELIVDSYRKQQHVKCSCGRDVSDWHDNINKILTRLTVHVLPEVQHQAIRNVMFLIGRTMRDSSVCCDSKAAAKACCEALERILKELRAASRIVQPLGIPFGDEDAIKEMVLPELLAEWSRIAPCIRRIDVWHRFVELGLRQRTVGSYEEILGQTDRAVVYNGGVQKSLYLADCLVNDFARKVTRDSPALATIYDSVKTILSPQGLGFVRIPTQNLFELPLAVPDLWHEVGVFLFFLRRGAGYVPKKLDPSDWRTKFITQLHDHYGDLIIFLYGFHGDLPRFVASLVGGWHAAYGDLNEGVQKYGICQLMTRLYLVVEFAHLRTRLAKTRRALGVKNIVDRAFLRRRLDKMKKLLQDYPARYTDFMIPAAYWNRLFENVTSEWFGYHRGLYGELLDLEVPRASVKLNRIEKGEIVAFDDKADLNDYFGEVAYLFLRPDTEDDPQRKFTMITALAKSAATEYHRRQMTAR